VRGLHPSGQELLLVVKFGLGGSSPCPKLLLLDKVCRFRYAIAMPSNLRNATKRGGKAGFERNVRVIPTLCRNTTELDIVFLCGFCINGFGVRIFCRLFCGVAFLNSVLSRNLTLMLRQTRVPRLVRKLARCIEIESTMV
jgi:hypothetical protein